MTAGIPNREPECMIKLAAQGVSVPGIRLTPKANRHIVELFWGRLGVSSLP